MNDTVELYGTTVTTETIALIKINNKFGAFSKSALNEILSLIDDEEFEIKSINIFGETRSETVHICNVALKLIEDKS